ncbi:hypothetical protein [Aeromicrobium sp.]|uniref:sunset domain-containing protein n=1 Tax=Aeromicrobium sp. TaxID=1871063 RepID=UPI003C4A2D80
MKFLLILVLIAVIAVIGFLAVRSRTNSTGALPPDDRPDEIGPGNPDDNVIAPPPAEVTTAAMEASPLPPVADERSEPEVVAETVPPMEPAPVVEPLPDPDPVIEPDQPPMDPDPIVEPEPQPVEPEPVIEPDPQPVEPEPVIEPDTAGVDADPPGEALATDPDEPTDPPQAVIDAGEMPAQELDPNAGWETSEDQTIHADPESGIYHTPDSPGYQLGPDGQVFESEDEARSAGFTRWDEPA